MCPLCSSTDAVLLVADEKRYWHCLKCDLHYLSPEHRLTPDLEIERYRLHDAGDEGYLRFVAPLIESVQAVAAPGASGLDFGAGNFPVLSQRLVSLGYKVSVYDPFFWPVPVDGPFDFITSCEVIEHLYNPAVEFASLYKMLKPGGLLAVMTEPWGPGVNFSSWYYRRDPTHVVFYSEKTFNWIAEHFGFTNVKVDGRLITLTKKELT